VSSTSYCPNPGGPSSDDVIYKLDIPRKELATCTLCFLLVQSNGRLNKKMRESDWPGCPVGSPATVGSFRPWKSSSRNFPSCFSVVKEFTRLSKERLHLDFSPFYVEFVCGSACPSQLRGKSILNHGDPDCLLPDFFSLDSSGLSFGCDKPNIAWTSVLRGARFPLVHCIHLPLRRSLH